jgi:hypothetical protein
MLKRLLVLLGLVALARTGYAADHADGPNATQSLMDFSGDITDLYTFNNGSNVVLIMDVGVNATATSKFSNAIQYVFHVAGITGLADNSPFASTVICTFDAAQKASCWLQNGSTTVNYATGDASATTGIMSADGKMKVFAGPRNDPFFFNIQGFRAVTKFVAQNISALVPIIDGNGCPHLDAAGSPVSSATVRNLLTKQTDGSTAGADDFAKSGTAAAPLGVATLTGNVLSLVVQVPAASLTSNGTKPILSVWGSTHK